MEIANKAVKQSIEDYIKRSKTRTKRFLMSRQDIWNYYERRFKC